VVTHGAGSCLDSRARSKAVFFTREGGGIIMAIQKWQCVFCKTVFETVTEAGKCESYHSKVDDLEIVRIRNFHPGQKFPNTIEIKDRSKDIIIVYHFSK